jgi:hypothetical protein
MGGESGGRAKIGLRGLDPKGRTGRIVAGKAGQGNWHNAEDSAMRARLGCGCGIGTGLDGVSATENSRSRARIFSSADLAGGRVLVLVLALLCVAGLALQLCRRAFLSCVLSPDIRHFQPSRTPASAILPASVPTSHTLSSRTIPSDRPTRDVSMSPASLSSHLRERTLADLYRARCREHLDLPPCLQGRRHCRHCRQLVRAEGYAPQV